MKCKLLLLIVVAVCLAACSKQNGEPAVEDNPMAVPYQPISYPDIYADYLNRDIRDDIFYFVMPDRFNNANPDNDNGSTDLAISRGGYVIDSKWGFHGGDIQGVEEKLDYLKDLGVSAIWMTPILRNQAVQWGGFGHHGYWIVDFTQIDPHFGSNQDLKNLIDAAHNRGIKIFFDIITNHTADIIRFEECHNPDGSFLGEKTCPYKSLEQLSKGDKYTPFIPPGQQNVKVPAWLNDPKYYHNQGDSFWQGESVINGDFAGLDDLNTLHPDVIIGMIEIYKNIITEFKPDGFRIDTVKHVHMPFWEAFSPAIIEHAKSLGIPNFHIFGEVYTGDPVELSSYTTQGKMPSVLDFGFQQAVADIFYRDKHPQTLAQLFDNDDYYNDHDSQADLLMNFLGNHDMGRSGFFIYDGLGDIGEPEALKRSQLSHALMYFSRGIPVIYYGDEQGFTGDGGDVDAREDMFASQVAEYNDNNLIGTNATTAQDNFDKNHPMFAALSQLAEIRMHHKALRRGATFVRLVDPKRKVLALSRVDKQEQVEYLLAFNSDTKPQILTLDASADSYSLIDGKEAFKVTAGKVEITLPGLSYSLLKAATKVEDLQAFELTYAGAEIEQERVKFDYQLGNIPDHGISMLDVTTKVKNSEGNWTTVAIDSTPPYSAIMLKSQFDQWQPEVLQVTATSWNGKSQTLEFAVDAGTTQEQQSD